MPEGGCAVGGGLSLGSWREARVPAPPSPRCWLNPSPPAARSCPCAQRGCGRAVPAQGPQAAESGEAGSVSSSWKIKRVFPLQNSRKEGQGGREESAGASASGRVSAGSDRDITPSRCGGTSWAAAPQRGQTGRQRSRSLAARPRPVRAAAPLCMRPGPRAPLSDALLHGVHGHVVVVAAHGQVRLRGEGAGEQVSGPRGGRCRRGWGSGF